MSENTAIRLLLKGALSELSAVEQAKIKEAEEKITAIVEEYGDAGIFAVSLVGLEKTPE